MRFSERVSKIKPSPTLAITAKANALRAEGQDVIGFGAGEPDFDTPLHIKEAAIEAIRDGFTKYTAVGGTDELKDAIIEKFEKDNGLSYTRSQVVVSCGAKHTLYNLAQALFGEGDEVIVPSPYWVSYPPFVLLAGAEPVILETREEEDFKITPEALKGAITSKTKAVFLNSPCNPTGTVYSREELKALADVLCSDDILVISDDIYEKIIYDGCEFSNIACVSEEMKEKSFVVNGVSKAYAMTGWRIGYGAGPEGIVSQVSKIQSQNTSNPTSISQKASVTALMGSQAEVGAMVSEFEKRRDYIVGGLNGISGFQCMKPKGAFYAFPNVSSLFGTSYGGKEISDSASFADYLLDEAKVAVVPGIAFGSDAHIRLSYATSLENIEKGLKRIAEAVDKLG